RLPQHRHVPAVAAVDGRRRAVPPPGRGRWDDSSNQVDAIACGKSAREALFPKPPQAVFAGLAGLLALAGAAAGARRGGLAALRGAGSRPSRWAFLRASLRARRTASPFSRARFSEGFS